MEFMNRMSPSQPQPRMSVPAPEPMEPRGKRRMKPDWLTWGSGIATNALLFVGALLIAALVWFIISSQPATQSKYVDSKKLQAVFLNTGQVYFGTITSLTKDYLVLNNVFYLQSSSANANSKDSNQNVSLVKLGCELHKPYDAMFVNMSEVTFWENLQTDGQVAKAVTQYAQQNPNGQTCSNQPAPTSNLQNQGNKQ